MTVKEAVLYRVFLKHHLGEMECATDMVQEHVKLSGSAPIVGKPLLALPRDAQYRDKKFAIPYGEVLRVEVLR